MNLFNKKQKPRDEDGKEVATVSNVLAKAVDDYIIPMEQMPESILMITCPKCGGIHFRHAGYVETVLPYIEQGGEPRVVNESHPVKICVKCKTSVVAIGKNMYDITEKIDLEAWQKTEIEAHKATGHGGQC